MGTTHPHGRAAGCTARPGPAPTLGQQPPGCLVGCKALRGLRVPGTHPATPQGANPGGHPRSGCTQPPCRPSGANPAGVPTPRAASAGDPWILGKEGPPDFHGLSFMSHFVPKLTQYCMAGAWGVFLPFILGVTTHLECTFPHPIHSFLRLPIPLFDVKPRAQTEITSPDSLGKSCLNCNTALLSSLFPKVCVSLDGFAVFSLVVWFFSSLLCHAASQLVGVISAVSLAMGGHRTLGSGPSFLPLP